ncbi:hypothetical protein N7509_009103 [Penicillium cosmopolitanum]|uniref:Extracellular membrane protein CFEM domain-containing protein n=1 Tax=Penicillium cosmopolitanum TaxID=1131564 RepID=A0A9W9VNV4_9EURO|nr:uncharacterized protein N7509_009103 [Penicillium cosmopolitanum]KAJ5386562.1 hypothetical protein N7509_009103 [Penicillium cosmopolitanum]
MRSFIATAVFVAGVTAKMSGDYLDCATAALDGIDTSKFKDCTDLSSEECFCNNKDAIESLTESAEAICKEAGIDLDSLTSSLCPSNRVSAPARHASNPMEPANMKRAYSPSSETEPQMPEPRVVYVTKTETHTACSCKTTPAPAHISQIPVDVPVSSSMIGMLAASSPVYSNGVLIPASSSVLFGSSASAATPSPSGADPNRFSPFQGAAPQVSAAHSGIAALGVAAIMGLMIAL